MPTLTHAGHVHELTGDDVIGAHRSCLVVLTDLQVERRHARIFRDTGLWLVEDCGTAAGTLLNGERLTEAQPLVSGAVLRIGGQDLVFAVDHATTKVKAVVVPSLPWLELAGRMVGGHQVESAIGRGSIGMVYRAVQPSLQRRVAFKVFDPAVTAGAEARFRTEVAKIASLKHPGLATLHEAGSEGGLLWCSLELVEGETAAALLQRDGVIAPAMALLMAERVAEATAAAHAAGVIHGDLRPTTIFIAPDGRVRLTDVGQLSIFERAEFDPAGPARLAWYTSPEAFREGAKAPSADVYSLGCVLWHLLVGRVPFDGPTAGAVAEGHARKPVPALPTTVRLSRPLLAKVNDLLQGLMGKTASWRPQTMLEVVEALRALRTAVETGPAPVERQRGFGSGDRPRPRVRTSGGGWVVPLVIALVVIGGVAWMVHTLWPKISAQHLAPPQPESATTGSAPKATLSGLAVKPTLDLRFDDPADLLAIEVLQGQPRLDGGGLTGAPGEAVGIACPISFRGKAWQIEVHVTLSNRDPDGQAVMTLQSAGTTQAVIRIGDDKIQASRGAAEGSLPRPSGPLILILREHAEGLRASVDGREIARLPAIPSLTNGQLRIEVAGLSWTLDQLTFTDGTP